MGRLWPIAEPPSGQAVCSTTQHLPRLPLLSIHAHSAFVTITAPCIQRHPLDNPRSLFHRFDILSLFSHSNLPPRKSDPSRQAAMAQFYPQQSYAPSSPQNLQFYPSSYSVSGHTTPSQAAYGGYGVPPPGQAQAYPAAGGGAGGYGGFGGSSAGVSGRMGDQGGLRTGWLAAFGTEGYDGEPPLLEELGVNFDHIQTKVSLRPHLFF